MRVAEVSVLFQVVLDSLLDHLVNHRMPPPVDRFDHSILDQFQIFLLVFIQRVLIFASPVQNLLPRFLENLLRF